MSERTPLCTSAGIYLHLGSFLVGKVADRASYIGRSRTRSEAGSLGLGTNADIWDRIRNTDMMRPANKTFQRSTACLPAHTRKLGDICLMLGGKMRLAIMCS